MYVERQFGLTRFSAKTTRNLCIVTCTCHLRLHFICTARSDGQKHSRICYHLVPSCAAYTLSSSPAAKSATGQADRSTTIVLHYELATNGLAMLRDNKSSHAVAQGHSLCSQQPREQHANTVCNVSVVSQQHSRTCGVTPTSTRWHWLFQSPRIRVQTTT